MAASKEISLEEVAKHDKDEDLWIAIHGNVYNLTAFLTEHPGGEAALSYNAGKDSTENFDMIKHSDDAKKLMEKYIIGKLKTAGGKQCDAGEFFRKHWKAIGLSVVIPAALVGLYQVVKHLRK